MDDAIYRIVSEFEAHHSLPPNSQTSISESALLDLQTLLDNALNTDDHLDIERLYDELSSKNLSVSSLVPPFMASMDSGPINLSLMAANVYLSLILSPNAPVFTLFTPMAFLSLLRSIRRFLKNPNLGNAPPASNSSQPRNKRGGGRRGPSRNKSQNVEDNSDRNEESQIDIRILFSALERLEHVLRLVHLDRFPDSMKSLIQTVAEIPLTAMEVSGASGNYNKLCQFCSKILIELLKPEHGDQLASAAEVLKSMSNSILLVKSPARTYALGFVVNQMMALAKDSNEIRKAVVNAPKYLVQKVPEKADARSLAVESILEITKSMEFDDQVEFTDYVVILTQSKTRFRLLAVDLIQAVTMSLRDPLGLNSETTDEKSWGLRCIEALIERCVDSAATIRARALSNLGQLVGFLAKDDRSKALLKNAMGCNEHENRINSLLRRMCADEKAAVRKAALTLISKLTSSLGGSLDETMVKTMGMACSDSLVSIRKAAVSALSETFRRFSVGFVTREWLHSVPRLITDNETSIQEECENLFLELVLDRISESHDNRLPNKRSSSFDPNIESKDGVLNIMREVCDGEVMPWVRKICTNLGKKKRLKYKVVIALQDIVKASESAWLSQSMSIKKWTAPPGAWFLLSELSLFLPKAVEWEFLRHHWELFDKHGSGGEVNNDPPPEPMAHNENIGGIESNTVAWAGDRVFLLQTISNVSVELPPEPAADLAHSFLRRIEEFNMHPTEINAHVKALRTVCKQKALNVEEAESLVMKWVSQLLTKASHILDKFLSNESEKNKENNFFTPTKTGGKKGKRAEAAESKSITAVYTIGSLVIICPTADLQSIVPLLHKVITSGNSNSKVAKLPGLNLSVKKTAPSLYIQAWLTMGKICLADGKLAKRYIPLFMQELEKSDLAALRNNIVVMMADFCVRYTALVDCYMSKITKCLRDPCELVRRQTFVLLSRLLQRDYVKWRGVLFLGFLLSLVDESEKIRQLADYLFNNILKAKAPLLAYNGFVEAIFVLNDCNAHTGQCNSKSSNAETRIFAIKGNDENPRSKRMHIYVSLLKQMAPEHLLATFAKVCAEVLVSASDGKLNLEDSTGQSVLQDCFQILACKEIKIIPSRGAASDLGDIEEEVGGDGAVAAAAARGKAITQAVKKGLIQNAIPIFIELKKLLESKNSPLIGSLMECLRIILKDYKNEIDEILIADKQLQKELIYDMQKYETMKEKPSKDVGGSSGYQSPPPGGSDLRKNDSTVVASAMADAAAAAVAESVLKDVNGGKATPPLSAMNMPKLKSAMRGVEAAAEVYCGSGRGSAMLESLRRRHSFESDEEN